MGQSAVPLRPVTCALYRYVLASAVLSTRLQQPIFQRDSVRHRRIAWLICLAHLLWFCLEASGLCRDPQRIETCNDFELRAFEKVCKGLTRTAVYVSEEENIACFNRHTLRTKL
jgi:hypothetical protein